jgi:hypothetical protein
MPFRPWNLWKPERPNSALSQEVQRLSADPRVHRIFDWFSRNEREIAEFQLAVTVVAAPPFGEQARADWMRNRLSALTLATSIDAAGNLLAARAGTHPEVAAIALSAHLDTVFAAGTELNVRR